MRRQGKTLLTDEENVRLCLEHDPVLAEIVAFDEFAEELLVVRPTDDGIVGRWITLNKESAPP